MLRVFDEANAEHLSRSVRIEAVIVRPLRQLLPADLHRTFSYRNWEEVQRELSFFEKRTVESDEDASIIEFSYL